MAVPRSPEPPRGVGPFQQLAERRGREIEKLRAERDALAARVAELEANPAGMQYRANGPYILDVSEEHVRNYFTPDGWADGYWPELRQLYADSWRRVADEAELDRRDTADSDGAAVANPYADWDLGDDSIGRNAHRALRAANVTPTAAAAMTPAELAAIPGLGKTRLARVRERLARTGAEPGSEAGDD